MEKKTSQNNLKEILKRIFALIIEQLKGAAVKVALSKLLGSPLATGFRAWLIKFLVEYAFDKIIVPIANELQRRGLFIIDVQYGKATLKLLQKAKDENDKDKYIDIITNI